MPRLALPLALLLLAPAVPRAQELSLAARVHSPLLHLGLEPADEGGGGMLERLLGHPVLRDLGGTEWIEAAEADPAASVVRMVRTFLTRSRGGMELALTGILPGVGGSPGRPLVIFRGRLTADDAGALRARLSDDGRRSPADRLGDADVWQLEKGDGPGTGIRAAVVGRDLVVSNSHEVLEEVLEPSRRTRAGGDSRPLLADPGYQALREELPPVPGTMSLYVDLPRMKERLVGSSRTMARVLFWSGIGRAESMLARIEGLEDAWSATALFELGDSRRSEGSLALLDPAPVRTLLAALPIGGLAGVTLSIDRDVLVDSGPGRRRTGRLRGALTNGCRGLGLDFDNQVLRRLGSSGAVQWLLPEEDAEPVWSVRARSRRAAENLFEDIRRAVTLGDIGTFTEGRGRTVDEVRVRGGRFTPPLHVVRIADALVFGGHSRVVQQAFAAARAGIRDRRSRDRELLELLRNLDGGGRRPVVGLFFADLEKLLGPDAEELGRWHAGTIELEETRLRVRWLAPH